MKKVHRILLKFLENDDNKEKHFRKLINKFEDFKFSNDKHVMASLLHLIANIAKEQHQTLGLFSGIEKNLCYFKDQIINYFSNSEIFTIFKRNKRILLFLFKEKIMIIDEYIANIFISDKYIDAFYPQYFAPEIKPFIKTQVINEYRSYSLKYNFIKFIQDDLPDDFFQKRIAGVNDNYICELIRSDNVIEFITYVNHKNFSIYHLNIII